MGQAIGESGVVLVGRELSYDPITGLSLSEVYEGLEDGISAFVYAQVGSSLRVRSYQHEGAIHRAVVTYGRDPSSETGEAPNDFWEVDTDAAQADIFSSWKLFSAAGNSMDVIAQWRDDIADKMEAGPRGGPLAPSQTGFTGAKLELYHLYVRGQIAVEEERKVLRRVRTYSITFATRSSIDVIPVVYKTNALIRDWDIPAIVASMLPDDPPVVPDYTTWAWKKRQDVQRIIPGQSKIEDTVDFVFAAWANLTHQVIT